MDIQIISLSDLALAFLPVILVLIILHKWSLGLRESLYGFSRMALQLLIIGYFLTFLFAADFAWVILGLLSVMVLASSWIALRTSTQPRRRLFKYALASILIGGGITFIVITQAVLDLDPWFQPRYVIPLGGMIFGGAMNAISLAAERFETEIGRGEGYQSARDTALKTALIPITNSLFAVGLVSLPGMMTGQILSGVDPLISVRYQIMVMCMLFASAGLTAACYLHFMKENVTGLTQEDTSSSGPTPG